MSNSNHCWAALLLGANWFEAKKPSFMDLEGRRNNLLYKHKKTSQEEPISHPMAYIVNYLTFSEFKEAMIQCFKEAIAHVKTIKPLDYHERRGMFVTSLKQAVKRTIPENYFKPLEHLLRVSGWNDLGELSVYSFYINVRLSDYENYNLDKMTVNAWLEEAKARMASRSTIDMASRLMSRIEFEPQNNRDILEVELDELTKSLSSIEQKIEEMRRLNQDAEVVVVKLADVLRSV